MKRVILLATGLTAAAVVGVGVARAAPSATAGDGRVVGVAADVPVTIVCDPGFVILEAHLSLSQQDGAVSGMAGVPSVRCDGRPHTVTVTVRPFSGSFAPGSAFASPFVLTIRRGPSGTTAQGGSAQTITLS